GGVGKLVIKQHPLLIIAQREQGFSRVRLQFLRILESTLRCIAPNRWRTRATEKLCVRTRKPCPGKRKTGIKLHRPLKKTDGLLFQIAREEGGVVACFKSHATQIRIVSLRVIC